MKTQEKFNVGDKVRWTSSGTTKFGHVVAIVPAGKTPGDVGYPKAGGGGGPRDHDSCIVRGWPAPRRGDTGAPRKAWYWPVVSLIYVEATAEQQGKSA